MSDVDSVLSLLFGKRRRVKKRSAKKKPSKKSSFGRKTAKKACKKGKESSTCIEKKMQKVWY